MALEFETWTKTHPTNNQNPRNPATKLPPPTTNTDPNQFAIALRALHQANNHTPLDLGALVHRLGIALYTTPTPIPWLTATTNKTTLICISATTTPTERRTNLATALGRLLSPNSSQTATAKFAKTLLKTTTDHNPPWDTNPTLTPTRPAHLKQASRDLQYPYEILTQLHLGHTLIAIPQSIQNQQKQASNVIHSQPQRCR